MSSSDIIEIRDELLAFYKGDFNGILIYKIFVGCLPGLRGAAERKIGVSKRKKRKWWFWITQIRVRIKIAPT